MIELSTGAVIKPCILTGPWDPGRRHCYLYSFSNWNKNGYVAAIRRT